MRLLIFSELVPQEDAFQHHTTPKALTAQRNHRLDAEGFPSRWFAEAPQRVSRLAKHKAEPRGSFAGAIYKGYRISSALSLAITRLEAEFHPLTASILACASCLLQPKLSASWVTTFLSFNISLVVRLAVSNFFGAPHTS